MLSNKIQTGFHKHNAKNWNLATHAHTAQKNVRKKYLLRFVTVKSEFDRGLGIFYVVFKLTPLSPLQ